LVKSDGLNFALAGVAALFAGTTQEPLNIMIMIPEMTGDFGLKHRRTEEIKRVKNSSPASCP
jgi:hypothetical protein